jgi:hypothetical protein
MSHFSRACFVKFKRPDPDQKHCQDDMKGSHTVSLCDFIPLACTEIHSRANSRSPLQKESHNRLTMSSRNCPVRDLISRVAELAFAKQRLARRSLTGLRHQTGSQTLLLSHFSRLFPERLFSLLSEQSRI